jgi:peptide/nickel transport system permease protein
VSGGGRKVASAFIAAVLLTMVVASWVAPDFLSPPDLSRRALGPLAAPPFGTDTMGVSLLEYALQGARIATLPAIGAGALVLCFAAVAGLSRAAGIGWLDRTLQIGAEVVGALPRMVVVLVVALGMPADLRSLVPVGIAWAVLSAPGAMDEAAATAGRLGGDRFVEALRAHGFSAARIYLYHVIWLNLRPVLVRQAAEVGMQVMFLEISLSYLAESDQQPSFTHSDATQSWAALLYEGYTAIVGGVPMMHALWLGLGLVAVVAMMATAVRYVGRSR